jgi:ribosomal protein S18 acetylase RimI-like enzyme
MTPNAIVYKINHAKRRDILNHLRSCNDSFVPPLNQKVDVDKYSRKIFENADTFEAWDKYELIGLVAVYSNDIQKKAFITNVSVAENFGNMGVASELLKMCIEYIKSKHFKEIVLEVNKRSKIAKKLYEKFNFQETGFDNDSILMRYEI